MELNKVDNIEFDGIDHSDYPKFCDAYVTSADYDGEPMTEQQLDQLQEEHGDFVYDKLWDYLH